MRLPRLDAKSLCLVAVSWLAAGLAGCNTPDVGAPCLPEQVPSDGFQMSEAYIESSSVQCATRVCMVYHLQGDPREGCMPPTGVCDPATSKVPCPPTCSDQKMRDDRVYCTCRCDAGNSAFATCKCPDGFSCQPVLEQGGPGVRGSYCVRNGTFTSGS